MHFVEFFLRKKNSNINKRGGVVFLWPGFFKELGRLEVTMDSEQVPEIGMSEALNQAMTFYKLGGRLKQGLG